MLRACFGGSARCKDHSGAEAVIFGAPTDKAAMPAALKTSGTQPLMHKPRAFAWTHVTPRQTRVTLVRLGMRR
jgi:hypothetical protein